MGVQTERPGGPQSGATWHGVAGLCNFAFVAQEKCKRIVA